MTKEEHDLLLKTGEVWNEFLKLPILHPDDRTEFKFHIHAIQTLIASRQALKLLNESHPTP